jgi:dTDP-4-dehydrorhamnose 3,5-epimerase
VALQDDSVVSYLVSEVFSPTREHGITPLDETIGLEMPLPHNQLLLSPKDVEAPTLREAQAAGLLPSWDAARAFTGSLDTEWRAL